MALIKICESDNWVVCYDRERGMYRVSYFDDSYFVDECWFDVYEEREVLIAEANKVNQDILSGKGLSKL